ncbi:MAG TPA: hypothetical protein VN637_02400 [Roseiarcus sp.]|nr:hypothetical protein [Roseiarcus sp.]
MTGALRKLIPTTAILLLALGAASGARADCDSEPGDHVFALADGDHCLAAGEYDPTAAVPTPPGNIVGLFAQDGGVISADTESEAGFVAVNANAAAGSYAIWSEGAGETGSSLIDLAVPVTVTTSGSGAFGLYASGGGTIVTPDGLSVTLNGEDSIGVRASGAGSTIDITGATIVANDPSSIGVQADAGGFVTLSGGSVKLEAAATDDAALFATGSGSRISAEGTEIVTNGPGAFGAVSESGGSVVLDGASVTTNGAGSAGIATLFGSISATGTTITTNGSVDVAGQEAAGVLVEGKGATGGLIGDTIVTKGFGSDGILVQAGGHATLSGVNGITTAGDRSIGLHAVGGGVIDVTGPVTIATGTLPASSIGADAYGVNANGAGSQINLAGATTVTTLGTGAYGLYASNGGVVLALDGPSVTTSGLSAIGVHASGPGSSVTVGGGATIATGGALAPAAQADGTGLVTLNGASLTTSGDDSHALFVSTGSQAVLSGPNSFATSGAGAIGLYAFDGGVINATGVVNVSTAGGVSLTSGLAASGVNADGLGSQVNLAATTTVTTTGANAFGLYASNGGTITALDGPTVTTSGPGAIGVYALGVAFASEPASSVSIGGASIVTHGSSAAGVQAGAGGTVTLNGGSVTTTGAASPAVAASDPLSTVRLDGAVGLNTTGDGSAGLMAAAGGSILSNGTTSIGVSGAGSAGVQALSGAVTASGALNVTTLQASSAAFTLGGTSPSILASGGGTVSAAGNAIAFTGAAGAVATFDNFNIKSSGDLILADPSTATVNFNSTVANAGAGNLLNATFGSTVNFNANASTLTGAIQTDATSTTNVSLTNGSNWTMSASSAATSLSLANSAIVFSPSGGFKTLTVGSYVGMGANIALNTALGGPNAGATDQLVINGGSATGLTALTIKNTSGTGSPTTGAGIPVVVVAKGGTTAPGAFYLADNAPVLAGGQEYTLGRGSNQDWYLTSSPAPTMGDIQNSVTSLAQAQINQMITTRLLGSLLLGANEQVSGCDCGGGFASIGSFSLGSHGRWSLNDSVTLLAGAAFEQYYQDGANVHAAPIVAASLRYDPPNWGKSRPFFEVGAALAPYIDTTYTRYYTNGLTPAQGVGSAVDRSVSVFGRIGWVDRLTPIDEVAVFADLVRGWQQSGGYTEAASAVNPFPATVSTGVDRQDVVRFGATYTRLLFGNLEANVNAAIAYGFDNHFGSQINVVSFGSVAPFPLLNSAWTEFGGRLGYRFSRNLAVDVFLIGTLGGEIGPTLHGGLGVRYAF